MDLQRSLLIGAIAVLSFMLLTEWVQFKEEREAATTTSYTQADQAPADTLQGDLPDLEQVAAPHNEDLPTAPGQATDSAKPAAASKHRSISVTTDTLRLDIDLHGGDIVQLGLPKHPAKLDTPEQPFVLLEDNPQRVYVAQSGLIGSEGIDSTGRAHFSARAKEYALVEGQDQLVVDLHWTGSGNVDITKRFTFTRGDYLVKIDYLVKNNSDARWQGNLFGQIKRDSSPAPSASSAGMGLHPFLGAAMTQPDDHFAKYSFDDIADKPYQARLPGGWIAVIQHYFLSAWVPNPEQSHNYSMRVTNSGYNIVGFTGPAVAVDPGQSAKIGASFYAGPKDQYRLKEISPYLDLVVDYGWLWWIAQPLFWLLIKIHGIVGNWGVAIILLTVLVKGLFFKLSATSYRSMAKMRQVQPKMVEIRERYADDKQKQSQAMMDLYRKEKVNPMGGCLPVLVQMPVFISLYWVLMESVELRQAPFILWIKDLSVMDPYFVLPIIMGAGMWFAQKLNPPPPDPTQAKIMQWLPIVFTFFFLWFPSGLVLYWVVNQALSIAQQWVITRQIEKAAAA
ncbi:membrane protein insertase YidC [Mangrovimicrobium sediminis]|uniref:Membrane protein insertase YidC n=1 Tax=Mangrovimicrobium sediminis TaxID=2562682 RepID=A0A4Z0M0H9_9GAMM|nr:membrane protein insertase YidC [Haliea sp. SAOS-164]TGD72795.1 membrane protein insertase YidC [Haliea sp. SAOS-164]